MRMRGTEKRCCSASGAPASAASAPRLGAHDVGSGHVGQRHGVRHRLHALGRGLLHLGHGVEDDAELADHAVELGVGQLDAGQAGEVGDVVAGQGGHAGQSMGPPGVSLTARVGRVGRGSARSVAACDDLLADQVAGRSPDAVAEEQDDEHEDRPGDDGNATHAGRGEVVLEVDDDTCADGPPQRVPMPPSTVMSTTLPDVVHTSSCREAKPWLIANTPPARPARPAERTKAMILYRSTS